MLRSTSLWLALLMVGALAISCSDDSEGTKQDKGTVEDGGTQQDGTATQDGTASEDSGEAQAPEIAFDEGFADYDIFDGQATIKVVAGGTVTKVELLQGDTVLATAEQSPFDLTWDTTATQDGLVQLSLKATGPAGEATADARPVIVMNNGEEVSEWLYDEAPSGVYAIPEDYDPDTMDLHAKVHWAMPEGVYKVLSVITFDSATFEVKLSIGTGTCPHSGVEHASLTSTTSPVAVEFASEGDLPFSSSVQWFNHVGVENATDHLGESMNWSLRTFLFR